MAGGAVPRMVCGGVEHESHSPAVDPIETLVPPGEPGPRPVILPALARSRRPLRPSPNRSEPVAETCTHLGAVEDVTPSSEGCEDCLPVGQRWVHLRLCMHCGHVGCCDSSPNRHATAHWRAHHDHPLVRSYEPGEDWWWCYADELVLEVADAPPAPSHP